MSWTTPTAVRGIINQPPVPTGFDLTPFIATADAVIDNKFVPAAVYTDSYLSIIAMWLAAHYVVVDLRRKKKTQAMDDAMDEYEPTKAGDGLKSTEYGKQVLVLDDQNVLRQRVQITTKWLGKRWE